MTCLVVSLVLSLIFWLAGITFWLLAVCCCCGAISAQEKTIWEIGKFDSSSAEFRSQGIGRRLLQEIAAIAVQRNCGRMEWWVLDWNKPAIGFYERMGAKPMDEWTVMRVDGDALAALAAM